MKSASGGLGSLVGGLTKPIRKIPVLGDVVGGASDFVFGQPGRPGEAFRAPGFEQQGAALNNILGSQFGSLPTTVAQVPELSPLPGLSFDQRNPFQFTTSFDANQAVGDAFTPQAQALEAFSDRRLQQQNEATLEDLNRRGLLTAGATTEQLSTNSENAERNLLAALAPLAAQQANAQLGANQFGANLDFQRQLNQAQEVFRQQGAEDSQAQALAQNALARRASELQPFALQQDINQRAVDNFLRLFGFSTGGSPSFAGTPGLLQGFTGGFAQGLGSRLGGG